MTVMLQLDHRRMRGAAVLMCAMLSIARTATAQSAAPEITTASDATAAPDTDAAALDVAEPDFVVVNLPSTLRLPRLKGSFRLTHRFAGNLRNGSFAEQAGNLFGVDQGAIIGFEYRFAVANHVQAAFYRSSFSKTIQLYGKYDIVRQSRAVPVSISPVASIEGTDNFQQQYAPAAGASISRHVGSRFVGYLTPMWVHNSSASVQPIAHDHDDEAGTTTGFAATPVQRNTTYLGLGGRTRIGGSTYVAADVAVRVQGYAPGEPGYGVSLEKRVGAHMFALTFTNTFATTFGQLARGGNARSLYLGFNLARKFF